MNPNEIPNTITVKFPREFLGHEISHETIIDISKLNKGTE